MTCFCSPNKPELSALFVQFELQWMLIHCDPLRPSRETCHELPVRIAVSSFYHLQRPSTQQTPPRPTSPLSFSKNSRLCRTNQVDIEEVQVPPHNLVGRNQPWVSGSTFGVLHTVAHRHSKRFEDSERWAEAE